VRKLALVLAVVALGVALVPAALAEGDHSTGARTIPVHRLTLRDENDVSVLPTAERAWPLSVSTTCGACHDYDNIAGGHHFNASTSTDAGRDGEPWVWVDAATGTQLPLSYRKRPGAWKPGDLGVTAWQFTQRFARHMPGAGVAEPLDDDMFDPDARWMVSGKLEANCLGCHSTSDTYSPSEWAKQVGRENFRWAATAASGMGDVGGMATRQSDAWLPTTDPGSDPNVFNIPPAVQYDERLFDRAKHRTYIPLGKPADKRCLYCHSVTEADKPKWQMTSDVHTASGMACVSCHRNGEDHNITRGYEGEAKDKADPAVGELSCKGCHLGVDGAKGAAAMGGKLGAPRPVHGGLPAVHLDKLTCTACHSGPVPTSEPTRVWTSRANRLGVAGRAQWRTDSPAIVEPVFMRNTDGKIAPHRMMWPSFWGKLDGEKVTPLLPDDVAGAAKGILDASQQVGTILGLLAPRLIADQNSASTPETADEQKMGGEPVFIVDGKLYRRDIDGGLKVEDYTGKMADVSPWWAREKNGEILPLIRLKEDLTDEDEEPSIPGEGTLLDDRIMEMIRALETPKLGLGQPVLDTGAKVYQRAIVKNDHGKDPKTGKPSITYDITLVEVKGVAGSAGRPATPTFAWLKDGELTPLVPDFVVKAIAQTVGTEQTFTEAQTAMMLKKLAADKGGKYVYVSAGKMFALDGDKLTAADNKAAEAVSWAMAHDVRPASQALGVKGCTDCHSSSSPMLAAQVAGVGPMKTDAGSVKAMYELAGLDNTYHALFGLTFTFRTMFKALLITTVGVISLLVLGGMVGGVLKVSPAACVLSKCAGTLNKLAGLALCAGMILVAVTGLILYQGTTGYALLMHVFGGAIFAVTLAAVMVFRVRSLIGPCSSEGCKISACAERFFFWALAVTGLGMILTSVVAMTPLLGTDGQICIAALHAYISIPALVSGLGYACFAAKQRRAAKAAG